MTDLLRVEGLRLEAGGVPLLRGVDLAIGRGETVGLVGESGSGKTLTALSVLGLLPRAIRRTAGRVLVDGVDVGAMSRAELERTRGGDVGFIFQNPLSALNPAMTIGAQIAETVRAHRRVSRRAAWDRAVELLELVGIPAPARRAHEYPHQLSGGMRQRAMIAIALSCEPRLLIADEPTTALDVTIQAQILELLRDLVQRLGVGLLIVTHDLGVIAGLADRVVVMYGGEIMETGPVRQVLARPAHPYTAGLMASAPRHDVAARDRLASMPGEPPQPSAAAIGCPFASRCPHVLDRCRTERPPMVERAGDRGGSLAACWVDITEGDA
jgi:oligopeptide/dipeptide ABC transporter ATP-binding protein